MGVVQMKYFRIFWDADPDDPNGKRTNTLPSTDWSIEDVEEVLANPTSEGTSESSGRPCVWGYTLESVYIIVVYDEIDEDSDSSGHGI